MITLNNRKLCNKCFAEIGSEPCPYCGYSGSTYRDDLNTLGLGSVLNKRYMIGGVLGRGGFGITYLAYDLKLDIKLAVKEYFPVGLALRSPENTKVSVSNQEAKDSFRHGAEKFYNEAKIVAGFNNNPYIVSVHDFFYENDTVYFIMEYLPGETLKSYLKHSTLTEGQALKVMQDISSALMAVHSSNILHRDIAPDNIRLCDDGRVKLLDFGAARQVIAEQSQSLSVIFKRDFAPLEQYQKKGKQGPWTDIYALGATIYNALTGELIDDPMTRFEDDSALMDSDHGISGELWNVIKKCINLKIDDRYQNISELKNDLNALGIIPEPIVIITPELQTFPAGDTAGDHDSSVSQPDKDATELLSEPPDTYTDGRETIALKAETDIPQGIQSVKSSPKGNTGADTGDKKNRNINMIIICVTAVLLILAGIGIGIIAARSAGQDTDIVEDTDAVEASGDVSEEHTAEEENEELFDEEVSEDTEEKIEDEDASEAADGISEDDDLNAKTEEPAEEDNDTPDIMASENNDNEEFHLDGSESKDYECVTHMSEYDSYYNMDPSYFFYYPLHLYSSVNKENGVINGKKYQNVKFTRSDGSRLEYTARDYNDTPMEEKTESLYELEASELVDMYEIYPMEIKDGTGFFIITGRETDHYDNLVYLMVKVINGRFYRMKIVFPDYENDMDKDWKGYYAEFLYRNCSFTNSKKSVRTFEEYKNAQ